MDKQILYCPKCKTSENNFYGNAMVYKEFIYDKAGFVIDETGEEDYEDNPNYYYCCECSTEAEWIEVTKDLDGNTIPVSVIDPSQLELPLNSPFEVE